MSLNNEMYRFVAYFLFFLMFFFLLIPIQMYIKVYNPQTALLSPINKVEIGKKRKKASII